MEISVIVATYNQEHYIGQTLESIVNQKLSVSMEILVGEDCSTDGTAQVVRQYEEKYPNLIKASYRKKNLGILKNPLDLLKQSQGKYIAFLEGDDYWTDMDKLQKQYDFLESHPDYVAVFGKYIVVDEENQRKPEIEEYMPRFLDNEYSLRDFNNYYLPGQTCTGFYRADNFRRLLFEKSKKTLILPIVPGDQLLALGFLSEGKIYNLQIDCAAYRYIVKKGSSSWSSKHDYFSFTNMLLFLFGLKYFVSAGKKLGLDVNFNKRLEYEFAKVADQKGKMPWIQIQLMRGIIFLSYQNKKEFFAFLKQRKEEYLSNVDNSER